MDYVGSDFGIKAVVSFNAAFGCGDLCSHVFIAIQLAWEIPKLSAYYSALDDNHDLDMVQRFFYLNQQLSPLQIKHHFPVLKMRDSRMGVTRVRHQPGMLWSVNLSKSLSLQSFFNKQTNKQANKKFF